MHSPIMSTFPQLFPEQTVKRCSLNKLSEAFRKIHRKTPVSDCKTKVMQNIIILVIIEYKKKLGILTIAM